MNKTCHIGKGLTDEYYAITKFFKDGSTNDKYKYKIENWDFVQQCVLKEILEPLGIPPELWNKFVDGKAAIVETDSNE